MNNYCETRTDIKTRSFELNAPKFATFQCTPKIERIAILSFHPLGLRWNWSTYHGALKRIKILKAETAEDEFGVATNVALYANRRANQALFHQGDQDKVNLAVQKDNANRRLILSPELKIAARTQSRTCSATRKLHVNCKYECWECDVYILSHRYRLSMP